MNKRDTQLFLHDILDAIKQIEIYTKGMSLKEFSQKQMIIDAVVRNLEIIGEASKKSPVEIKSHLKDVPWKEMAGMRDKIIHEYFGVDLEIIWKTVQQALPPLKEKLNYFLQKDSFR